MRVLAMTSIYSTVLMYLTHVDEINVLWQVMVCSSGLHYISLSTVSPVRGIIQGMIWTCSNFEAPGSIVFQTGNIICHFLLFCLFCIAF